MSTIRKVALSNNRKNKTRSILIMVSIFLTTVLLTVICTCAYGFMKSQKANAAINYGSYYGTCQSVNMKQLKEMRRRGEFSTLGLMATAGIIDSEYNVNFLMTDQNARDLSNMSTQLVSGDFPQAEDEIAAQAGFFESLGYRQIHVGDTVSLDYRKDLQEKFQTRTFTVSGILKTRNSQIQQVSYTVYASQAFYEAQFAQNEQSYSVLFRLSDDSPITYDDAEEVIHELVKKCGIAENRVHLNSNYLIWAFDPGYETLGICGGIACIVIFFSIIVIYNIFQVGIVQKIQEYGKIRALGATKKQMRRLIYNEGMVLAACSIPPGVLVGFAAAWGSFRWLMQQSAEVMVDAAGQQTVSLFSLPVLLFGALLSFATVWLALRRPMKIVAGISPIEAVRYQERSGHVKSGIRKGKKNLSVTSLAFANLAANRKRTVTTILTMGLSCVLFVTLANCVGNIDSEYDARKSIPYGQFQIDLDYALRDKAYPENNLDVILQDNPLNAKLIEKIQAIQGVTQVHSMDILSADVNGRTEAVAVYDEDYFNREKEQGGVIGVLNYEDNAKEDIFYFCWSHFLEDYDYTLDQQLTMELTDGTKTCQADGILKGSFGSADVSWAITKDHYQRMGFSGASTGWLWVDCEKEDTQAVRQSLEQLLAQTEHVEMRAFEDALKTSKMASRTMKLACYLFLGIIGLIGFMNLANTMIMNIITKKQEYGILQAVGMTNRQMNMSLQLQGMLFTIGTVLVAIVVGLPAGYEIFVYAKENAFFGINVYHVPLLEIGVMVVAIAVLQLVLSCLLSRNLKKESLVERIRYQG